MYWLNWMILCSYFVLCCHDSGNVRNLQVLFIFKFFLVCNFWLKVHTSHFTLWGGTGSHGWIYVNNFLFSIILILQLRSVPCCTHNASSIILSFHNWLGSNILSGYFDSYLLGGTDQVISDYGMGMCHHNLRDYVNY